MSSTFKKNQWIEISLPVSETSEEPVSNFLFELGASGCFSQFNLLKAYFDKDDWNDEKLKQFKNYLEQLAELGFQISNDGIKINSFKDRDWNAEWKKTYRPFELANRFIIKPSWVKLAPNPDKIIIEIDPQMAFGTGTHETTQLVLELMREKVRTAERILDIGTGTGILSIAAAKIYDAQIFAFDNDPIATATAKENFKINNVADRIELYCANTVIIRDKKYDLILANITRSVIESLLSSISSALTSSGTAIFTGILIEEKDRFKEKLRQYSFKIICERELGEWLGFVLHKEFSTGHFF